MRKLKSILLVDDDDITNTLNQLLIRRLNIAEELITATNGKIALDIILERCENQKDCPELVLVDINMPVMNGFEFLKVYDELEVRKKHPIVVVLLSTSTNFKDVEDAGKTYISEFLNKPLTEQKINSLLTKYFNNEPKLA